MLVASKRTFYSLRLPSTVLRVLGQDRRDGGNGHLDHAVVRLKHGQMLHPDAGLPDDAGRDIVRPAAPLEQLVADAHDQRQGIPATIGEAILSNESII